MSDGAPHWYPRPDCVVVWTRPEAVIPSFADALAHRAVAPQSLLDKVDHFAELLLRAAARTDYLFVPTWTVPGDRRGLGMLDLRAGGAARGLLEMNLRLAQKLEMRSNVFVLDAARWVAHAGKGATSPKLWYMGKVPFSQEVFREAAGDVKAALRGVAGRARKLVVVDLDDTLWGGIVGEVGWENIVCGGHDPFGEAIVDFQRELKADCGAERGRVEFLDEFPR